MKQALIILLALAARQTTAQNGWTVQQCMQYAVVHNHEVKQAELQLDNYRVQKTKAVGSFLPYVDAGIGAQYNFGRAIDPETNGYTDVSTFYNGYQLQASLPVFDGFSRLHALKAAKAGELMGRASLRQQQDLTALDVLQAYTNVAYYEGLVSMAGEKVQETTLLLKQTRLLEEVGRKSAADVAQVESQQAEADYELTRQQNLQASALLELKKAMGFPISDSLSLTPSPSPKERGVDTTFVGDSKEESNHSPLLGRGAGGEASHIFNNVPLDSMLTAIAAAHGVQVEFENEAARGLRFHFVWKREDSLTRVVEKLNTFEAVNIVEEDKTLVVR